MISLVLLYGGIFSLIFMIMLVTIAIPGPRIMLQDYPKAIQSIVPPKTKREKRLTFIYSIPIVGVFLGFPSFVTYHLTEAYGWNVKEIFLFAWLLLQFVNLFDLLVIDWLMFCFITPKFVVIKGSEGHAAYKDYLFHFRGFLKGIVISSFFALVVTGLVTLFTPS